MVLNDAAPHGYPYGARIRTDQSSTTEAALQITQ